METNKNKKSVKFQGDLLNFCDFIQVFVFTRNHHLNVFPNTNCPYHDVKVTCFGKSVKVLTGEFSTFTIKSLQINTSNAIGKLNLMKIKTIILTVNSR